MDCPETALLQPPYQGFPLRCGSANVRGVGGRRDPHMGSNAKRQTTMAKLNRERRLKERREMKAEKKEARKLAAELGETIPADDADAVDAAAEPLPE
jgi:hypothetical protein